MSAHETSPIANDAAGAHSLHRLVRPFEREATARWREREDIRNALARIRDNADEAWLCLEKAVRDERDMVQASTALREMEALIKELWPNEKLRDRP